MVAAFAPVARVQLFPHGDARALGILEVRAPQSEGKLLVHVVAVNSPGILDPGVLSSDLENLFGPDVVVIGTRELFLRRTRSGRKRPAPLGPARQHRRRTRPPRRPELSIAGELPLVSQPESIHRFAQGLQLTTKTFPSKSMILWTPTFSTTRVACMSA